MRINTSQLFFFWRNSKLAFHSEECIGSFEIYKRTKSPASVNFFFFEFPQLVFVYKPCCFSFHILIEHKDAPKNKHINWPIINTQHKNTHILNSIHSMVFKRKTLIVVQKIYEHTQIQTETHNQNETIHISLLPWL